MPITFKKFAGFIALFGLWLVGAAGSSAQQKINPATQVSWPSNCTASGLQVYNYLTNTCIPASASVTPIVYRGTWNSVTTYAQNNAVFYGGSQYVSLQAGNLNQNPSTAGTFWALLLSGGVTAANMQAALAAQTGCTTNGFAWNPATNTCTSAAVTAAGMQAALAAQTGCTTAGFAWNPATNTCSASGGSVPPVIAAPTPSVSGPVKTTADADITANHFTFNDGTDGWYAGNAYHADGDYIDNTGPAMLANPRYFSSAQVLNEINKFLAAAVAGRIPISVGPDGVATRFCSFWDANCVVATGDAIAILPQLAYLHYRMTGSTAAYSAIVTPWKTAVALVPRNGSTHLFTVLSGNQYICGEAYEEVMRNTGDVSQCNVWYAWNTKIMAYLAGIAGDSTNQTFFAAEHTTTVASIQAEFVDSTTKLLIAATGNNSGNLDVYTSALAVYCDYDSAVPCGVMTAPQKTAIASYFNANYSTLVNSSGFVLNSPTNWAVTGQINPGGSTVCCAITPGTNQDGYWPRHIGWFMYALNQNNPAQVATQMQAYLAAANTTSDPAAEFFNRGTPTVNAGTTNNLVTPMGPNWIMDNIPVSLSYTAGQSCVLNKYGACANGAAGGAVTGSGTTATIPIWTGSTVLGDSPLSVGGVGPYLTSSDFIHIFNPSLAANANFGMGTGKSDTLHNAVYNVFWNTTHVYGSFETYAKADPVAMGGSQLWLNGGPVFVGNTNADGGATLPTALGLFHVGTTNQFWVATTGETHSPQVLSGNDQNCTAPGLGMATAPGFGITSLTSGAAEVCAGTLSVEVFNTTVKTFKSTISIGWSSGDPSIVGQDVGIDRFGVAGIELNDGSGHNANGTLKLGSLIATTAPSIVGVGQLSAGSTTAAAASCGSLAGAAGCWIINVAGTTRNVPYY
jgi:hypothetical protein